MEAADIRRRVEADAAFAERYTLDAVVGSGGMGEVWRGLQRALKRPVAIKFMSAELAQDAGCRERFFREAEAAAGLVHTHVVAVFDYGVAADVPYLVTELVEGVTLAARLESAVLAPELCREIMLQVLEGLDVIHQRGIVHRDLKPANILLRAGDRTCAKILDFGVAKQLRPTGAVQTGAGLVVGTPAYMAPEQIVGDSVSPASDLYSATVMFHQMLTGGHPFGTGTALEVLQHHLHREPRLADTLPPALAAVFARGLAKDPRARFQTAREYQAALQAAPDASPAALDAALAAPAPHDQARTVAALGAQPRPRGTRRVEAVSAPSRRPAALVLAATALVLAAALILVATHRAEPRLTGDAPRDLVAVGQLLDADDAPGATKALFAAIREHTWPRPPDLAELAHDAWAQNADRAFLGALELWLQRPPAAGAGEAPEPLRGEEWLPRFAALLASGEHDRAHRALRLFKYGDRYDGTKLLEPTPDAVAVPELSALNFLRAMLILRTADRAQSVALGVLYLETIAAAHPQHPISAWAAPLLAAVDAQVAAGATPPPRLDAALDRAARVAAPDRPPTRYPRLAGLVAGTRAYLDDTVFAAGKPLVTPPALRRALLQAQVMLAGCDEWREGGLPWRLPLEALQKRLPEQTAALRRSFASELSAGVITLDTPLDVATLVGLARQLAVPSTALIAQVERDATAGRASR